MNDHHFSYPVVVPLQGVTISGHSSHAPGPAGLTEAGSPSAPRPRVATVPFQGFVRHAGHAAPAPGQTRLALAW
jgi:hypothetical protein